MVNLTDPISGKSIPTDALAICNLVVGKQASQVNPSMLSHFGMLLEQNPNHLDVIIAAQSTACSGSWFRVQPRCVTPGMRELATREKPWLLDRKARDAWVQAHKEGV